MEEVTTIGLDIAKQIFHVHGADASGATMFSRRITRQKSGRSANSAFAWILNPLLNALARGGNRTIGPVMDTAPSFSRFHPGRHGSRTVDQGGSLARIQFAVEAKTNDPGALPPYYRRSTERSAVQDHGRPG